MSAPDIVIKNGRFLQTQRRDNWWLSPLLVFLGFGAFLVYANWAAFQKPITTLRPLHLPLLFARNLRRFAARLVRPQTRLVPRASCPSRRPSSSSGSPACSASPATTTAAHTTKPSGRTPPPAPSANPAKPTAANEPFRSILQNFHRYFLRLSYIVWAFLVYDVCEGLLVRRPLRHRPRQPSSSPSTSFSSAATSSAATPSATSSAAPSTRSPNTPSATSSTTASPASTAAHKKWAWASLFSVGFADIYVRLCSMGIWSDWRIF